MAISKVKLPDNSTQDINDSRIASADITAWNGKQDALVSGTNIKTVNNESLLGSGNLTIAGEPGDDGVGISSVVQTTESTESGGINIITVTKSDGTSSTFNVRNGDAVGSATIVQTTGDSTTSVMSQDAVSNSIEVWRDDVDCAYEASNLSFDGTNEVDTGFNPMYPIKNFQIYMEVNDLIFLTTGGITFGNPLEIISNYGSSSTNQHNDYFYILKASDTSISIKKQGKFTLGPFDVNTGSGSKNTISINVDETNLYAGCIVNGVKKSTTIARDVSDDLAAPMVRTTFKLGGTSSLSSFTLKSIRIIDRSGILNEPGTQLYDSYEKLIPVNPITRFDCVDGLTDLVDKPQSFKGTWVQRTLTSSLSNTNLLDTDAITIIYDYRNSIQNPSFGDLLQFSDLEKQNYITLWTSGGQFNTSYKINGGSGSSATMNAPNSNSVGSTYPALVCVSLNFTKNTVTVFKNGALIGTNTFNFSVWPAFSTLPYVALVTPNEYTRYFAIMNGEMDGNYAKEMFELYPNNIFSSKTECLSFAEPTVISLADFSTTGAGTLEKSATSLTYSHSGTNNNCYLYKTGLVSDYEFYHTTLFAFDIEITSGSMTFTGFGTGGGVVPTVFDSNGNIIGNAGTVLTAGNSYHIETRRVPNHQNYLIRFQYTDWLTFTITNLKKQSLGPVVALSPYTYKKDYFELFNGDRFKVSDIIVKDYGLYKTPTVFSGTTPSYNGQLKMEDNKVYVGYMYGTTVVWKQINNS